ncbi:hypothetical protein XELAEV_18034329mg [Xenopus laevis]|uniref:Uncharacterized protein n=1 Tax=Xenopus laevis TaxID=8355 RepID=A0A974CDQ2_XENLA|nr:hypothetical protein XELAEV_18034329mg [Xenopus laevis]
MGQGNKRRFSLTNRNMQLWVCFPQNCFWPFPVALLAAQCNVWHLFGRLVVFVHVIVLEDLPGSRSDTEVTVAHTRIHSVRR